MTSPIAIRVLITILTATQAMIAAALGFSDMISPTAKFALVIASTGLAVVLNQIPSWTNAGAAAAALKSAGQKAD